MGLCVQRRPNLVTSDKSTETLDGACMIIVYLYVPWSKSFGHFFIENLPILVAKNSVNVGFVHSCTTTDITYSCPNISQYRMMTSSNGNISALLAICAGNSLVIGEFPAQRPVMRSFDVFYVFCAWINSWVNNREAGDWLWCHCNVLEAAPIDQNVHY